MLMLSVKVKGIEEVDICGVRAFSFEQDTNTLWVYFVNPELPCGYIENPERFSVLYAPELNFRRSEDFLSIFH